MSSSFPLLTKNTGGARRETDFIRPKQQKTKEGGQEIRNRSEQDEGETLKKGMLQGEEKRDGETKTERQREAPGTERQGCGERSLISQHHLLPFPGLKAPLMSNLPQPHTSRAPQSRSSRLSPAPFLLLRTPYMQQSPTHSHPPQRHKHTLQLR